MKFNLTIIRPKGFLHSSGFNEVTDSLAWALSSLGHHANISHNWFSNTETNIVFGCELLSPNQPQQIPVGTVIYNLEQPSHPNMAKVRAIAIGSKATVWDYSLKNVEQWRDVGVYARHVPIGYTPNLTRIPCPTVQDIDVLFLGWMTLRRKEIIEKLKAEGLNVVVSDGCYGGGRDNLISRAKVVLNVHHDGRNLFEIVRVSYLMANYKTVVSEFSADQAEYADLEKGLVLCDYERIVPVVVETLRSHAIGFHAFEVISRRDFTASVAAALTDPTPQEKVAVRYAAGCKSGDMKDFLPWLREHAKGTCLEIGVRDGASTSALLAGVEANGGVVLSLDIADCSSLFVGHPQWKFIQGNSQNQKLRFPQEGFDLVLIDGDHTPEGYRADLERFFPLVKPGGLILSHDIMPDPSLTLEALPGSDRPSKFIREEYFKFAEQHCLKHYELPGENGMGVISKLTIDPMADIPQNHLQSWDSNLPNYEPRVDSEVAAEQQVAEMTA